MSTDPILELETISAVSWPANVIRWLHGWQLRFHWGVTHRANSVWPNALEGELGLAERIAGVERFYQGWGRPACFQVSPASLPVELDSALDDRGYRVEPGAFVQTTNLKDLARRVGSTTIGIVMEDGPGTPWFGTYLLGEPHPGEASGIRRALMQRIAQPRVFARLLDGTRSIAVGIGVVRGSWVGVFCMATRPEERRRGAARAVLGALAGWGREHGARNAYLQVHTENEPGIRLYESVGFQTAYEYHYRSRS